MSDVFGNEWYEKVHCCVTDGASILKSSNMLAKITGYVCLRCVQHAMQCYIKHFCASQHAMATAMECCSFIAKTSSLSHAFSPFVGTIGAGTPTPWNCYVNCAENVLKKRRD